MIEIYKKIVKGYPEDFEFYFINEKQKDDFQDWSASIMVSYAEKEKDCRFKKIFELEKNELEKFKEDLNEERGFLE